MNLQDNFPLICFVIFENNVVKQCIKIACALQALVCANKKHVGLSE